MPGNAASTGDTWVLGSAPNAVAAPENSFALAVTWAWTSRPITISHFPVRPSISAGINIFPYARAPCVLRDASLRDAPQDEGDLFVALKAYLILRKPRERLSRRAHCRFSHHPSPATKLGRCLKQAARSRASPTRSTVASSKARPITWRP